MAEPTSRLERLGHDWEDRAIPVVPIEKGNAYQLRDHLHRKVVESAHADPFKRSFPHFLGLSKDDIPTFVVFNTLLIPVLRNFQIGPSGRNRVRSGCLTPSRAGRQNRLHTPAPGLRYLRRNGREMADRADE